MNQLLLALLLCPTLALAQGYKFVVTTNDTARGLIGQHGSAHAAGGNDSFTATNATALGGVPAASYYLASNPSNYTAYPYLTSNTTVTITNTMSSGTIQGLITAQPRNLNGYTLTFACGAGTYVLTNTLTLSGFFAGNVYLSGVDVSNVLYLTQTTIFTNATTEANIAVSANAANVTIQDIRSINTSAGVFNFWDGDNANSGIVTVQQNYFVGPPAASGGFAVYFGGGHGTVQNNYFNGPYYAVLVQHAAQIECRWNNKTGTTPTVGHQTAWGGIIVRGDTTAIGTTDNGKSSGGQISLGGSTWF